MQGLHRGCEHEQGVGWPGVGVLPATGESKRFVLKRKGLTGCLHVPSAPPVFHGTAPGGGCVGSPLVVGTQKELLRSPSGLARSLYLQHFCRRNGVAPNSVSPSFGSRADCQCRHLIITLLHPGTTAVEATTSDLIIRNLQLYIW